MSRLTGPVGSTAYVGLLVGTALGLVLVALGPWRVGLGLIGVSFVLAAAARLVVRENAAGLLRVRRRWFDVTWMAGLGAALIVLAVVVPRGFA